jgi:hypothetical protein
MVTTAVGPNVLGVVGGRLIELERALEGWIGVVKIILDNVPNDDEPSVVIIVDDIGVPMTVDPVGNDNPNVAAVADGVRRPANNGVDDGATFGDPLPLTLDAPSFADEPDLGNRMTSTRLLCCCWCCWWCCCCKGDPFVLLVALVTVIDVIPPVALLEEELRNDANAPLNMEAGLIRSPNFPCDVGDDTAAAAADAALAAANATADAAFTFIHSFQALDCLNRGKESRRITSVTVLNTSINMTGFNNDGWPW